MNVELISPFPFEALPRVHRWIASFRDQVADDYAPKTLDEFVNQMAGGWGHQKTWAIYGDGELGGLITFSRLNDCLGTAGIILKPDFHGKGIAPQAGRMAVGEMFQQPGLRKVYFFVLSGNFAMGSLVGSIGGKREGTLEGHTLRDGKPTELWVYGLTKQNYEVRHGISTGLLRAERNNIDLPGAAAAVR